VFGMGGNAGTRARGLRLALLVAVAALFALIPAAQASAAEFTLMVHVEGEGSVECEVEGFPQGECGGEEFEEGTGVTLLAVPELGWEFLEWSGACAGEPNECEVVMDEGHEVTAIFVPEPVNENTLSVTIGGTGSGQVECELEEGPKPCGPIYPEESGLVLTEVTLIPVAGAGSEFAGFSGDCSGNECVLTMDEDHYVTATFNLIEGGGGGPGSEPSSGQIVSMAPLSPGRAKVAGVGLYKGGRAMLRISCKDGGGPCKGTVKLIAKLKLGHKTKKVVVGKAPFSLRAGASKVLTIKLSAPAKRLLGKGRTLTAKVSGSGVTASKVKIKPTER
jgi:hypothetical protein